ncbi:MAG: hypothetical protein HC803_10375 [Saprospiraceae bacterium]|nr:hypothetical protein [Saprospiraceae bacterium]
MGNRPVKMIDPDGGFAFGGLGDGDPPLAMDNSGHTGTLLEMPKYYQTLIITDFSYTNETMGKIGFSVTWQNWKYCPVKKIYEPIEMDLWSNNHFASTTHPYSVLVDYEKAELNKDMNKTYSIDGKVGAAGRGFAVSGGGVEFKVLVPQVILNSLLEEME